MMAPPSVFSHFRPQHRKAGSEPESPQLSQWQPHSAPQLAQPAHPHSHSPSWQSDGDSNSLVSPISPLPPQLPPLPRVLSQREPDKNESRLTHSSHGQPDRIERQPQTFSKSSRDGQTIFHVRQPDAPASAQLEPYASPLTRAKTEDLGLIGERLRPDENLILQREYQRSTLSRDFAQRPTTPLSYQSYNEPYPTVQAPSNSSHSPSSSFSSIQKPTYKATHDASPASSQSTQFSTSQQVSKPSRARMLLNPMSLWTRRRASQGSNALPDESGHRNLSIPAMSLPDDYDPRIKGKGVHDFNAPRPKRDFSNEGKKTSYGGVEYQSADGTIRRSSFASPAEEDQAPPSEANDWRTAEKEHTPVFVENFDDNAEPQSSSAVQRESLANASFLSRMSRHLDFDSPEFAPMTQNVPIEEQTNQNHGKRNSRATDVHSWRSSSDRSTVRSSISHDTKETSPPQSPPESQSPNSIATDNIPQQPSAQLKHFTSNASRFSFQITNDPSAAQEKLLEEKHKQKVASRALADSASNDRLDEQSDEEDYDDYDAMDDGLEEAIPGVNVDAADDDTHIMGFNPPSYNSTQTTQILVEDREQDDGPRTLLPSPMNKHEITSQAPITSSKSQDPTDQGTQSKLNVFESDDDMYFDDGMIEKPTNNDEDHKFDESVFDLPDSNHYAQQYLSVISGAPDQASTTASSKSAERPGQNADESEDEESSEDDQIYTNMAEFGGPAVSHQPSQRVRRNPAGMLSPSELAAYHSALASAAYRADADGKFERKNSVDTINSLHSGNVMLQPSNALGFNNFDGPSDYDFDGDTGADDDPMVAAANAEALANDEEGFYGREFGFYSNGDKKEEFFNGGFFGSGSNEDLGQSNSGRNAVREPNLTPITERSEFSTRNSFISLSAHPSNVLGPAGREQGLPGPGLAQIAASLDVEEDDFTLDQLIKLRRDTFGGGSQASLTGSVPSSPTSSIASPFAMRSAPNSASPYGQPLSAAETTTLPTIKADEELYLNTDDNDDYSSQPSSPTVTATSLPQSLPSTSPATSPYITQSFYTPQDKPLSNPWTVQNHRNSSSPPSSPPMPSTSVLKNFHGRRTKHQHTRSSSSGGGQDSVAYVREQDTLDPGITRWVLERRRTEETGEVRVIGREVVEGGRI